MVEHEVSCFFFFKQKTAYEIRISDWSSDVCSSDLPTYEVRGVWVAGRRGRSAPDADRIPVPHRRSGLRPRRLLIRRLIRNAVAEDPARGVGGVAPTYEVRGVWVAGRRGA